MKNTMSKIIAVSMLTAVGLALSGCSLLFWSKAEDPALVPFSTIPGSTYQRFVKNRDDKDQPVQCALIRSQSDWNDWFPSDPDMPGQQAMTPSEDYFDTRQLLLAARVIQAPDSRERSRTFTADKVTMRDRVLKLEYRFVPPRSGATYRVKDFLLVEIPRDRYTSGAVQFIENGETVCRIAR